MDGAIVSRSIWQSEVYVLMLFALFSQARNAAKVKVWPFSFQGEGTCGGWGVLSIMACTVRLRPKEVTFSGGRDFTN